MNKTFSLLFLLKKNKQKANGTVPLYARITIDGIPKEISCKRNIDPGLWDNKLQRLSGRTSEVKSMNNYLKTFEQEIYDAHHMAMKDKKPVTAAVVKSKVTGTDQAKYMLIPIFKEHNRKMWALVPEEYAAGTAERYDTSLKHTENFISWKYKVTDINIDDIDYEFITDYEFYLKTEKNCCHNTAVKYVKNFQKIINICLKNEWIIRDPFLKYEAKVREVEREYLTLIELRTIFRKKFVSDRLNLVRDIFVFSCYTGLAYIDVKQLAPENISYGIDGTKWIFKNRQKTDGPSNIPLLPIAQEILDHYSQNPKCLNENRVLPILSNQKMNSYLKEVADVCGINKDLTFHAARHTFATTVTLSNGVPIESVSKMLGHKNLKSTQIYARVLDLKVSADMQALRSKLHEIMNSEDGKVLLSYTG
jgi:site-specific recombinase XerD